MSAANSFDVLVALRNQITKDPKVSAYLGKNAKTIGINQAVNNDPSQTPWLGIYLKSNRLEPATTARTWQGTIEATIVIQANSLKSGEDCVKRLETITQHINYAIIKDTTLSGSIEAVTAIDISYTTAARDQNEAFFQVSLMDLFLQVKSHGR